MPRAFWAEVQVVNLIADVPEEVLRARRTAAMSRGVLGLCGLGALIGNPHLVSTPLPALLGLAFIAGTAPLQLALPRFEWLIFEESLAGAAAILIVGLAPARVTVLSLIWLAAVASGVLARGGRMFWIGRALLLLALVLPLVRERQASFDYLAFVAATLSLLLTCGRVTRELRGMLERARHDADHDSLTGALARAAFRARLDALAADDSSGLVVLLIDVDGFGAINKTAGHAAGDAALVGLVERTRVLAGGTHLLGRLGGDEFALVVRSADPLAFGRRMQAGLAADAGDRSPVEVSIGIARMPTDGEDADSILRAVDVALRVAKRSGRQQVSLYAGASFSHGGGGARADLDRLIGGEGIAMVVQPIVAVRDGRVHAYEALARFQTSGTSSPLHWFALADEFGVRDELELACLAAALALFDHRPAGTKLSVNLSGPLLLDERAGRLLGERDGLDGLILELTENSLLDDTAGLHHRISALIARGARFAVDDVGAGYSGLRQLTTVRPSYLKLDRSLIASIDADPDRGAMVSAMLSYARQTGGHLVAEGVETEAEYDTLVQLGVELVQGFYLGRPGWPWPEPACDPAPVAVTARSGSRSLSE